MDSGPKLSVLLCTHNPNREYLRRALDSLAAQTLAAEDWELIVVDNLSDRPLAEWADLSRLKSARVVVESQLGLTHARLRGFREAAGQYLVMVDDDNVLEEGYLAHALRIMEERPFLGAIGGKCKGEFERKPPGWIDLFYHYLAVIDQGDQSRWINDRNTYDAWYPRGAGMVLRAEAAGDYARQLENDSVRRDFDRRGRSLGGSGDIDIVMTVMDAGYAVGYFPALKLTHIIPDSRVTVGYMRRLIYHAHYSTYQLNTLRVCQKPLRPWPLGYLASIALCILYRHWNPVTWLVACEVARGRYAARRDLEKETAR